ncbi:hypothetical protein AMJ39_00745 [candidate division TA06 bacterium DG_24]|uniref:DUF4845 domain-containing protein n=3 Tax=Bacteria division TA06 TaxID=1156500 RepID=A0A0S8JKK4_UNCT6|nr:MAG: hypothetical protein AMJ39_00745 [candidate division TA06 bacterium DG_24]KPK70878.1 MAG: hypothetical protein AMJ82_01950 [candidate division TA06 bacterium SM23_40]KPL10271.1 MAG: hypothetical protein AMJ71_03765 [candidate division TA06 bacterium SM1_40]
MCVPSNDEWRQRGMGKFTAIILIAIVCAAAFVGFRYGALWLDYYRLRDKVEVETRHAAIRDDTEIKGAILESARELGIPLEPHDIKIVRRPHIDITVKAKYEEDFVLPGYRRRLTFRIEANEPLQ